ncbi:CCCH-type Zn-finger protein [Dioscorea alata]|uniref:CCCH-type Zn-finger protein n=1 Tax=Dioscorea alata TaxID=55571 RepID=A0ACB7W4E6_DIOAL|nr:CCCH-type Zn-finger protein [Dioscorea alata]
MAYNYGSTYAGTGSASGLSSYSSSHSGAQDPYIPQSATISSSRYHASDSDASKYSSSIYVPPQSSSDIAAAVKAAASAQSTWGDKLGSASVVDPSSVKRLSETLYHQTLLGTHNSIGQSEALYSANSLIKRPRLETGSILPIYPQRPGEKDCAYYMLTRTCKFGDTCKFDHPLWVPDGGIPDWKEIPVCHTNEPLPERPGEADCPYYVKTQRCKYGFRCKFNHPKDKANASSGAQFSDNSVLPERPTEPICAFYAKTGTCNFGATCKFHHPKDIQIPSTGHVNGHTGYGELALMYNRASVPALMHNTKGLPIRPGESDCPFYIKTGSCKYGAACRFNHPERNFAFGSAMFPSAATSLPFGILNSAANIIQTIDPRLTQATLSMAIYPQRPGQIECDFYMKTGHCKFGDRCRYDHPLDRSGAISAATQAGQLNVKLTLAGLPRREGSTVCAYYMKTGTCQFGPTCKYDHPPPGEAVAKATVHGTQQDEMENSGEEKKAVV